MLLLLLLLLMTSGKILVKHAEDLVFDDRIIIVTLVDHRSRSHLHERILVGVDTAGGRGVMVAHWRGIRRVDAGIGRKWVWSGHILNL